MRYFDIELMLAAGWRMSECEGVRESCQMGSGKVGKDQQHKTRLCPQAAQFLQVKTVNDV